MRTTLFSLLLVVIFGISAKAQDGNLDYYINTSGQKIEGSIIVYNYSDCIFYKPSKETKKNTKIPIDEIKMVVVNQHTKKESYVDTLWVVADGTRKDQKKYFGKLVLSSPGMHIYYKFKFAAGMVYSMSYTSVAAMQTHGPVGQWDMGHDTEKALPMYQENGSDATYELTSKNYIEILSKAVADYPDLAEQIQNKTFKFKEIDKIFTQYRERDK